MNVTNINEITIFYEDGTKANATEAALRTILNEAIEDKKFYIRMYNALRVMYDKAKVNFDYGIGKYCPDIPTDRDNYYERVGALSGLSDAMKEADKKGLHALQIETQCRIALGLERPNINEMYPEMRLKK